MNPVNGVLELFRAPLTNAVPDMAILLISIGTTLLLCIVGLLYFRKTESYFADIA
jgi:lipopolysaccharide transport system permease protein